MAAMTYEDASRIVWHQSNREKIARFLNRLADPDLRTQMLVVIGNDLPDCKSQVSPETIFDSAMKMLYEGQYLIYTNVFRHPASLELLAFYARQLRPGIFYEDDIPDEQLVAAVLAWYHYASSERLTA